VTDESTYLKLDGIHKSFGKFEALRDIALAVRRGELMVFLGPSGCGKTTLLRIVAGLETQDRGTIVQDGRDISRLPAIKRDYGIVFQSYALFPNLTIRDNVAYGLVNRRQGRERIAARVKELLTLVGLPDSGAKYPGQMSGGQQQRIALARALAAAPGLLLLDEPLSALDAIERVRLRAAAAAGRDYDHGDSRPGRGLVGGRPHRGDERRTHRAGRHAPRNLRRAGYAICRRLRRQDQRIARGGRRRRPVPRRHAVARRRLP
jgi:ABC-type Fe3+/spermidine/putrescine transport system ATPase subunit